MSAMHGGRDANAAVGTDAVGELAVGGQVPDFELLDHAGNRRRLSQLVGGDPTVLHFYRGCGPPRSRRSSVASWLSRKMPRSPTRGWFQ